MFKNKDIGRKIIILDTNNACWLTVGKEYKIRSVVDGYHVRLEDGSARNWDAGSDLNWSFTNKEPIDLGLEIGDRVYVDAGTTSIQKGETKEVIGFLNDDKSKPIVEGVLPGGWISVEKITKLIDIEKYRYKTMLEACYEFHNNIYGIYSSLGLQGSIFHKIPWGTALEKEKVCTKGKNVYHLTFDIEISSYIIEKDKPKEELIIFLVSKKNMLAIVGGNSTHNYYATFSQYADLPLSNLLPAIANDKGIANVIQEINKTGGVLIEGNTLPYQFLTIKKANEVIDPVPF